MKIIVVLMVSVFLIGGYFLTGSRNLDDIKHHATVELKNQEFDIVGYQGYAYSPIFDAEVWYNLSRPNDNTLYEGYLIKWGNEYHMYELKAINGLKNN